MTDDDNRRFLEVNYPDSLNTYNSFEYNIQRADFMRPHYLHYWGGVYIDLDLIPTKSFDSLFIHNIGIYLAESGNISHSLTNSFMASRAREPFWLYYIEEMKKPTPSWAYGKHFKVMASTGPIALTRAVRNSDLIYAVLPSKLVMPCSVCNIDRCIVNDEAFIKPVRGQSWNDWTSHMMNVCMCNWKNILSITFIIVIGIIIAIILYRVSKVNSSQN